MSHRTSSERHEERMRRFQAAGLYLVTSGSLSAGRGTERIVGEALDAGVRLIQMREKDLADRPAYELASRLRAMTAGADSLLILNDRLDLALAVGADGVHLGRDDLPLAVARRLAPDLIVGASSHTEAEAVEAERAGASYVNIGPLFPTETKRWAAGFLGIEGLRRIAPSLHVPYTVMGGIKLRHIPDLLAAGARTVAMVTEVTAAPDPRRACVDLLAAIAGRSVSSGIRC